MKRFYIAAATLLLSTSAVALAAESEAEAAVDKSVAAAKAGAKAAGVEKFAALKPAIATEAGAKLQTASADLTAEDSAIVAGKEAKLQTAMAQTAKTEAGMGGPLVESDATASADLTPQPAAQNYPPCDPGPGDDRCIQLYEPGVRAQLASWNRPTGGLIDGAATTAMGGPYEPVEGESDELAMNGDGQVAPELGETAALESGTAELAHHSDYSGVGGPVEAQSGYPPCDPGPGDDRCIQLYEPGVTGAGN